jgi:hypothetical protein
MSDHIDTEKQTEEERERLKLFGKRLELAVLLAGSSNTAFIKRIVAARICSKGSFYNHTGGVNKPQDKMVYAYEDLLGVPRGWLWRRDFTSDELDEVRDALKDGEADNPTLVKIRASIPKSRIGNNVVDLQINHSGKQNASQSSITVGIRHIPILPKDKISAWLAGERSFEMLSAKPLPIPDMPNLGPRTWAHPIADNDFSMTGPGDISYPPRTLLTVDPDQTIVPGDRIVIRKRGVGEWLVRRYQAPWPLPADLAKAQEFTLVAANPSFEPIRVTNPSDWEVGGCVMLSTKLEKY